MLAGDVVKRGGRRGEPCVVYVEPVSQLPGELPYGATVTLHAIRTPWK